MLDLAVRMLVDPGWRGTTTSATNGTADGVADEHITEGRAER